MIPTGRDDRHEYTQLPSEPQYPAGWRFDRSREGLPCVYQRTTMQRFLAAPDWKPNEPLTTTAQRRGTLRRVRQGERNHRVRPNARWPVVSEGVQKRASLIEGKRRIWGPVVTHVQVDFAGSIAGELFELPAEARDFKNK